MYIYCIYNTLLLLFARICRTTESQKAEDPVSWVSMHTTHATYCKLPARSATPLADLGVGEARACWSSM